MIKGRLLSVMFFLTAFAFSQNVTVSGFISDDFSGEKLIGATVYDLNLQKGTSSNGYGFYSITLPRGELKIKFSFIGYQPIVKTVSVDSNLKLNINLKERVELKEFVVNASESEKIQEKSLMSTMDLSMEKVKSLPVLLGEKDVMKTIQLLPGVQSGSEGSSGLYVRGGGADQNLILLDGVPIYNASHLFGFFSVFNADAINSVSIIKGGFPARYGGRLSSVIDIKMKEGNIKEFHGEGSIGLISSKLTLEGPIIKNKTSFIVSGRRTYADVLARPFMDKDEIGGYYFYDINGKVNHTFSDDSRLYLSLYFGNDKFFVRDIGDNYYVEASLRWGNVINSLRWNKIINDKLFVNTNLRFSNYKFSVGNESRYDGVSESFNYYSGILDFGGAVDFDYIPSTNQYIKFGLSETYHTFSPGVNQYSSNANSEDIDTSFGSGKLYAHEFLVYAEDDFSISEKLKINIGIHGSGFLVNNKTYLSLQPRFSGRFLINETMAFKMSFAKMTQYLHLLSNTSIGLPTDLWVPATERIAPQKSTQIAVGIAKTLKKGFEVSLEGYYKWMNNLIEYKEGASFFGNSVDWQDKVEAGKGWSYGGELLLEKKQGKTTGWIGYTLSWTNRQFDEINFGEIFPYRYDRRHDIGIALTHTFNKKKTKKGRDKWFDLGLVWVYGTGNSVTLSFERYEKLKGVDIGYSEEGELKYLSGRNNFRVPSYHRLDLGINKHKITKWGEQIWSFGIYNAYSRQNPFYLYFDDADLMQVSLIPIVPSVSYSFKF
jgi:hypothetical protein